MRPATLSVRALADLTIDDEPSFRHVGLYRDLKQRLLADRYTVRVLADRWDHALLLNLAFWDVRGQGDVVLDEPLPADVVCHMAWHHLAAKALGDGELPLAAEALLLGEAVASAFDLYLVGRLLGHAPGSAFLETQLPAMADVAEHAGVDEDAFASLMEGVRANPEAAFEELRQLLYDVTLGLWHAQDGAQALQVLAAGDRTRFGCLLHHYELANWLQHARAAPANGSAAKAVQVDALLRTGALGLDGLAERWLA